MAERVPVIALTGYLGAGKTTVLNHLLRAPGARLGVVVNDFGSINVDAALVSGQIDEPASIAGGCLCCLPDTDGLDSALARLSQPRLRLDAVIVEASGVADPPALSRLIRFSAVSRVRPGGLVDVIDAAAYFDTVDTTGGLPPARFASASLVVINKTDRLPERLRADTLARITDRVRASNPHVHIVETTHGRLDPQLVFDGPTAPAAAIAPVTSAGAARDRRSPPPGQAELPLAELAREEHERDQGDDGHGHVAHPRADAVTVPTTGPVDPGRLADLIENPPAGVYRLKGTVPVDTGRGTRTHVLNIVGRQIHLTTRTTVAGPGGLVAIGMHLDLPTVRASLETALALSGTRPAAADIRRLARYRRLSGRP